MTRKIMLLGLTLFCAGLLLTVFFGSDLDKAPFRRIPPGEAYVRAADIDMGVVYKRLGLAVFALVSVFGGILLVISIIMSLLGTKWLKADKSQDKNGVPTEENIKPPAVETSVWLMIHWREKEKNAADYIIKANGDLTGVIKRNESISLMVKKGENRLIFQPDLEKSHNLKALYLLINITGPARLYLTLGRFIENNNKPQLGLEKADQAEVLEHKYD